MLDLELCHLMWCYGHGGSATIRSVGHWSDVLHAFAVSQFLRVRFEVVSVALLGLVDRTTLGDVQDV